MAHRYFAEETNGKTACLGGQDAKHLAGVLRAKPGQTVLLCDGAGTDYEGTITAIEKDCVHLALGEGHKSAAEPSVWAEVFIGMAKGERMDYAIQKAVELGASAIWPFYSAHSVVKPKNDDAKTQRYARIAHAAAGQSGRGIVPAVHAPLDFAGVLQQAKACARGLFFYEGGGAPLRQALFGAEHSLALVTGPEGGFSPEEAETAQKAGLLTVGLGPRILRCETAPAAALAAVMTLTGNLE